MKTPSTNSPLDGFITDSLKAPDADLPFVDWSEVEVLLQHESKQVSLPNSKYLIGGASAVIFFVGIFFLVKFIGSSQSSTEEIIIPSDIPTTLISTTDTGGKNTAIVPVVSDSTNPIDGSDAIRKIISTDTSATIPLQEKINENKNPETQNFILKEQVKKENKKSKLSSLAPTISDTGYVPESILPPDTASKSNSEKIKNNAAVDTNKTSYPPKTSKTKKGKIKNNAADSSGTKNPPPAKSDSLK